MAAALAGAGATLWRGEPAPSERLVAADEERGLRRDVARLAAERDQLTTRLAALEREMGNVKLAMREADAPEATGSVNRPAAPAEPPRQDAFALSLGADASLESVRRRWSALSARYPQALARLTPRAQRSKVPGVYDLVAGPFVTREEAERACGTLAVQGFACDTTTYAGDPLGHP